MVRRSANLGNVCFAVYSPEFAEGNDFSCIIVVHSAFTDKITNFIRYSILPDRDRLDGVENIRARATEAITVAIFILGAVVARSRILF